MCPRCWSWCYVSDWCCCLLCGAISRARVSRADRWRPPQGVALVVAPPRSGTLDRFQQAALGAGLHVRRTEQYGGLLDDLVQSVLFL